MQNKGLPICVRGNHFINQLISQLITFKLRKDRKERSEGRKEERKDGGLFQLYTTREEERGRDEGGRMGRGEGAGEDGKKKGKCKCNFVYQRSTKEFTRTRSEMSVHSRIELEFGNVGGEREREGVGRKEVEDAECEEERKREEGKDIGKEGRADALAGVSSTNGYKWQLENC